MSNNGLLAFAAGLGGGYLQAKQRNLEQARIDEDRAMRKEEFDARMDDVNRDKKQRISLADASAPLKTTEVIDIDPANPEAPRKTSYSLSDGRVLGSKAEADAAATQYNTPEAIAARQANAYRANGAPEKAITLENATLTQKRANEQYTQEQKDRATKLQQEGVFNAVRAFRTGDASGLAKAFNADGEHKLEGEPVLTREDRDVPGIGKIPTYNATLRIKGPDSQVQEKTYNSHDLSMQLMPYEKALEIQRKGTDSDNKADYQRSLIDAKEAALAAKEAAASVKSAGQPSREERLRYTTLFSEAGRRLGESQKTLATLQKDPMFQRAAAKPGTQQAQQLADLQETIRSHNEERGLYRDLLAGSQAPAAGKPSLADAKPKTAPAAPSTAGGTPDYSNLWRK